MVVKALDKMIEIANNDDSVTSDIKNALEAAHNFVKYGSASTTKISARVDIAVRSVKREENTQLWCDVAASVASAYQPIFGAIYAAAKDSPGDALGAGNAIGLGKLAEQGDIAAGAMSDALSLYDIYNALKKAIDGSDNPNYHISIDVHNDYNAFYGEFIFDPYGILIKTYGCTMTKLLTSPYYKNLYCPGKGKIYAHLGGGINETWAVEARYEY